MTHVDPADWVTECRPAPAVPPPDVSTGGSQTRSGAHIPSAEIDRLLRTISEALALGARNAGAAGYRLLCSGRAQVETLDPVENPWVPLLVQHWRRIQAEYLARHPGADRDC